MTKKELINRLKRTEGQLRGIQKMIEEDKECIDIVTQLTAVRSSVNRTMGLVIGQNIHTIIEDTKDHPEEKERKLQEAINLVIRK